MNKRTGIILVSSLLLNLLLITALVNNMYYIEVLEERIQSEEECEYLTISIPTWYGFCVDKDFPISKLIVLEKDDNRTVPLDTRYITDAFVNSSDSIEWWIYNYTIIVYDWTWTFWNGTAWEEEYAWDVEYTDWVRVYAGRPRGFYSIDFNITLVCDVIMG